MTTAVTDVTVGSIKQLLAPLDDSTRLLQYLIAIQAEYACIPAPAIETLHQGTAHIVIKGIAGVASHHQMADTPVTHDPDRTSHHLAPRLATTTRPFGR